MRPDLARRRDAHHRRPRDQGAAHRGPRARAPQLALQRHRRDHRRRALQGHGGRHARAGRHRLRGPQVFGDGHAHGRCRRRRSVHPGHREATTVGEEWEQNPFIRVWRGLDEERDERCQVGGQEATLVLWAPDYDGTQQGLGALRRRRGRHRRRLAGHARGLQPPPPPPPSPPQPPPPPAAPAPAVRPAPMASNAVEGGEAQLIERSDVQADSRRYLGTDKRGVPLQIPGRQRQAAGLSRPSGEGRPGRRRVREGPSRILVDEMSQPFAPAQHPRSSSSSAARPAGVRESAGFVEKTRWP